MLSNLVWKLHLHQVMEWSKENHAGLDILSHYYTGLYILCHCCGNVGWYMDHVSQVWNSMPWVNASPQTTSHTCSAVIMVFWTSLTSPPGDELVQWDPCRSRYATTIYQECGLIYEPYLIGDKHIKDHGYTTNHPPYMLSYGPAHFG